MTTSIEQKITSSSPGHNRGSAPTRPPRREVIEATGKVLKRGGPRKADLLLVDLGQGPILIKDFSKKSRLRRLLGRLQILHECRAYRRAGAMEGLPRLIGRVDAHALALERVEGVLLAKAENRFTEAELHLWRLRQLIDRLHARGLVHLDLRGKSNVLLRPDGGLVIVDLAAAIWFRPGSLAHRLLFPWFAMADETALLKWKARLAHDLLTSEEESSLKRFRSFRIFWVFNWRHARPAPIKAGGDRKGRSIHVPSADRDERIEPGRKSSSRPEDEVVRHES